MTTKERIERFIENFDRNINWIDQNLVVGDFVKFSTARSGAKYYRKVLTIRKTPRFLQTRWDDHKIKYNYHISKSQVPGIDYNTGVHCVMLNSPQIDILSQMVGVHDNKEILRSAENCADFLTHVMINGTWKKISDLSKV